MPTAVWTEVTVHTCDRPRLGSKATNQSQLLPTCVLILFFCFVFFPIYIYFLLLNCILFLTLSSPQTQWHCLSPGVVVSSLRGSPTALRVVCDCGCAV